MRSRQVAQPVARKLEVGLSAKRHLDARITNGRGLSILPSIRIRNHPSRFAHHITQRLDVSILEELQLKKRVEFEFITEFVNGMRRGS